jgi:hypothetical protein
VLGQELETMVLVAGRPEADLHTIQETDLVLMQGESIII